MIIFQIIAFVLCIINVFLEYKLSKEISEKVLLWLILSFTVIRI